MQIYPLNIEPLLAASIRRQADQHAAGNRNKLFGGPEEIRTPDPCLAKAVLYRLSYGPILVLSCDLPTGRQGYELRVNVTPPTSPYPKGR
jgi:hypothetical protein